MRRWTGIADRTRAARLEHSLHRQDGGKGTITNHREANAKGKPNMADTAAPNKLEPRIDSGTCRPAPGIARSLGVPSRFAGGGLAPNPLANRVSSERVKEVTLAKGRDV